MTEKKLLPSEKRDLAKQELFKAIEEATEKNKSQSK